jgi:CRISPR-associated endonuclease/helicase Cas3
MDCELQKGFAGVRYGQFQREARGEDRLGMLPDSKLLSHSVKDDEPSFLKAVGSLGAEAWAKRWPRSGSTTRWHALADHSADVAACLEALLNLPVFSSRLATLARRDVLPELWRQRLCVAAFLHDFGKANTRFQHGEGGHIAEATYAVTNLAIRRASELEALSDWGVDVRFLLAVALAHHGAPPEMQGSGHDILSRLWQSTEEYDPIATVATLVTVARAHWPIAFQPGGEPLPPTEGEGGRFWHGFLGLLQLADWIGSDDAEDAFPYANGMAENRVGFARARAGAVLRHSRLDIEELRGAIPPALDFTMLWGFAPHAIQRAAAEAPGPVVIVEAETGSGKTEAALWRFARLLQSGRVDGLYFALPTRVAATAMHRRVQCAADALFGKGSIDVLRALPGDVVAGSARLKVLPEYRVQWTDGPDTPHRRARWAAEHPKRFLAAPIAVGTIDQALLGAVCVKHAQMRSICLSRLLLVVDEVHASDTYMQHLLRVLLDQHRAAGGEALLLSATLGAAARTTLLVGDPREAQRHLPVQDQAQASGVPYPALSFVEAGEVRTEKHTSSGTTKVVEIMPKMIISDAHAIAAAARNAAERGAKVLVLRNLVRDAVATARALHASEPNPALLFCLDDIPTVHHGRFARPDRLRLDAEVERVLGKRREHKGGLVLIGTQTLEQSLDIDADLLITDLAPMDVLLQRIGRLHRHARVRPEGFAQPRVLVLVPETFDASLAVATSNSSQPRSGPHGLGGLVYGNLLSLAATRRAIGDGSVWHIPAMNRALVEAATHPAALAALCAELGREDSRWLKAATADAGTTIAHSKAAEVAAIAWTKPAAMFRLAEEAIGTRLGARDIEVEVDPALPGPFPDSVPITRLLIPAHLHGDRLPNSGSVSFIRTKEGLSFALGDRKFRYTRYGLEAMPRGNS